MGFCLSDKSPPFSAARKQMAPSSLVVTLEKPNSIALVEINESNSGLLQDKQKAARPKQFTWVLFLKVQRALAFIPWLATGLPAMFVSVKKRIALSDVNDEELKYRGKLYKFIKAFLAISVVALVIEIFAYFNNWDLSSVHPWEVQENILQWIYLAWLSFRVDYIAPLILSLSNFCIVLFMIQSVDRLALCLGCFWIKYKKLKPEIEGDPFDDIEDASSFPMVLVQIPMCNEKEVTITKIPLTSSPFLLIPLFFLALSFDSLVSFISYFLQHEQSVFN